MKPSFFHSFILISTSVQAVGIWCWISHEQTKCCCVWQQKFQKRAGWAKNPKGIVGIRTEECELEFLGKNFRKFFGTGLFSMKEEELEEVLGVIPSEGRWEQRWGREDTRSSGRGLCSIDSLTGTLALWNKRTTLRTQRFGTASHL